MHLCMFVRMDEYIHIYITCIHIFISLFMRVPVCRHVFVYVLLPARRMLTAHPSELEESISKGDEGRGESEGEVSATEEARAWCAAVRCCSIIAPTADGRREAERVS